LGEGRTSRYQNMPRMGENIIKSNPALQKKNRKGTNQILVHFGGLSAGRRKMLEAEKRGRSGLIGKESS